MLELLLIWLGIFGALLVVALGRPREGGTLTLAYFLGLSLIHAPGPLAFVSAQTMLPDMDETRSGFQLTLLGLTAFVVGAWIARLRARRAPLIQQDQRKDGEDNDRLRRASSYAIVVGAVAYFVLLPFAGLVPSLTSLVAPLGGLLVLGIWLRVEWARHTKRRGDLLTTIALLPLLPLATMATGGFIGYGVYWIISVVALIYVQSTRRWTLLVAGPLAIFIGLSLFVTYAAVRGDIRQAVWHEHATYGERLTQIARLVTQFQLLDVEDAQQMDSIDARLNQNWFVGRGVERHEEGFEPLKHGQTVAPWALIPRFLWPGKPEVAGSGHLIADYLGIRVSEGTSFGVGQVLEFYMNFGVGGVIAGFAILGFLLRRLDTVVTAALTTVDIARLLFYAMPGLMLLQPGGSLMEMLVAAVAAFIAAIGLSYLLPQVGFAPHRRNGPIAATDRASV